MITDLILSFLLTLPLALLRSLPDVNLSFPTGVFDFIWTVSNSIAYIIPVRQLLPILYAEGALTTFRIAWSMLIRMKSFIPGMGA